MFFPLLLVLLLVSADAVAQVPQRVPPTFNEAVQLADEGRDAEALAAFQQRAAANPNDHQSRLWIARLHERMGNPDVAEPVYHSVLLEDPGNIEAMMGVASSLVALERADDALDVLEVAEERAPQDVRVLDLMGRAHLLADRPAIALGYFERAYAIDPSDERRLRLESARLTYQHRFEVRGFSEQFSGDTPDTRSGDFMVNYRLGDRLRVIGRGQAQRKFAVSEQRGGGGVEWQWKPLTTLRGHVLVGPGNLVIPEADVLGEIEYTRGPATWMAGIRYFDFTGARTTVFSPAVEWLASDRLLINLRYAMSFSEVSALGGTEAGYSAHLRGNYRFYRRLWLVAGYAAGVEDFENFSIDRIGDFRANTLSGGARVDFSSLTGLAAIYEHQWRDGYVSMGRVTVSLQQRF